MACVKEKLIWLWLGDALILSQLRTVDSRWATNSEVLPTASSDRDDMMPSSAATTRKQSSSGG